MRKSGLTGDEAYALSKHGKTTEDLGLLKKELSQLKEDLANIIDYNYSNIFDKNISFTDGKWMGTDGNINTNSAYSMSDYFEVDENKSVVISINANVSYRAFINFFDKNKVRLGVGVCVGSVDGTYTFTTPLNTKYLVLSTKTEDIPKIKLQYGTVPTSFSNHGEIVLNKNVRNVQPIRIYVDKNGNGDYTEISTAINSIKDSSIYNPYEIYILGGIYDIIAELGYRNYVNSITDKNDSMRGVTVPPYVDLIGIGTVKIDCTIPSVYDYNNNAISTISAMNFKNGNNRVKNISFSAKNCRYAVHSESSGLIPDYYLEFENCQFVHNGNDDYISAHSDVWQSCYGLGMGVSSGAKIDFKNCYFRGKGRAGITVHDNNNFARGAIVSFYGCEFDSNVSTKARVSTYGTGTKINKMCFVGCTISELSIVNEEGKTANRWNVFGGGNSANLIESEQTSVPITHTFN